MAQTPSLGEILTVAGNAEQGFGANGKDAAVIPFSQGINFLNQAAQVEAQAQQFKYKAFQDNMDNYYKTFNSIDISGLSPADQNIIGEKYAAVAKDIADNIDVIKNPSSNPTVYSRLKSGEADLNRMISASKMHKAFDEKTQEFTKANPDWQDLNKPKLESSLNTTSDVWKPYTLDMPVEYSPAAIAKLIEPIAEQKYALATAGKGYITKEEGLTYKKQAWDDAWEAVHGTADKNGRSLLANAQKAYEKIPPEARGGTFEQWLANTRDALRPQDQVTKQDIDADQKYLADERNRITVSEGAADRANRLKIASMQIEAGKEKIDPKVAGRIYNENLTGFKTGDFSIPALQNIYGDNSKVKLKAGSKIVDPNNPMSSTETATEVDVPKRQVVGSRLDANGNLVYKYIDYSNGPVKEEGGWFNKKPKVETIGGYEVIESQPIPYNQGRTDFYRVLGDKFNPGQVADAAEKYRVRNKLGINPDLDQLTKFFYTDADAPQPAATTTVVFDIIPNKTQTGEYKGQTVYTNDGGKTYFDVNKKPVKVP